jgi:anti-sigma28 factor (negative regulator of flagellin synthesis)
LVQTFQFRTETEDKSYHHTIHAGDETTAVEKWIRQIEDLQNQVYSFDTTKVQDIKQQYSNGNLKVHVDKEPYFLILQIGDKNQIVHIDKINKGEPDFLARVSYLTTEQGGRKGHATSGYRPQVKFDGRKELTSCEQLFIDKDKVFPGESVTAEIRILGTDFFKNYLFVGQHFEIAEASHLVGHGEILQVVNPNLRQASR